MIRRTGYRVAMTAPVTSVVLLAGCGSAPPGTGRSTTETGLQSATSAPTPAMTVAGGPVHCENPKSVQDLTLRAYLAVEASAVPAKATVDGITISVPLTDVKILWQAAPNNTPPRAIEADHVPLDEADQLLPAGRYVLLLGAGHAGHWYPAMGRMGMFAYVDPQGKELTQFCTVYTATPQPPTLAPGSVSRTTLLALLKKAPLPAAMYSPPA